MEWKVQVGLLAGVLEVGVLGWCGGGRWDDDRWEVAQLVHSRRNRLEAHPLSALVSIYGHGHGKEHGNRDLSMTPQIQDVTKL